MTRKDEIKAALRDAKGNKAQAARALGISRSTLRNHLKNSADPLGAHQAKSELRSSKGQVKELLERLHEMELRQGLVDALARPFKVPEIKPLGAPKGKREACFVALASDWHVEETVFKDQVAGINEYDLKIADQRIRRFFEGCVWLLHHHRQSFEIKQMVLSLLGDLITGYIHEELEETNAMAPLETIRWLKARLIWGIKYLLEYGELTCIKVPCSHGNHGRVHKRKRIKTGAQNSFEWAMYLDLMDHFADDPRVEFVVDKSAHQYVQAFGFDLHFHHGDDVKYSGGVGGVSIPLNKRVPQWDRVRRCHYHHIGHFHQYLDGRRWMVNGSLIGYSEYSFSIGADPEPPQQGTYLIDSKRGKTCVSPLWVDEKGFPKL